MGATNRQAVCITLGAKFPGDPSMFQHHDPWSGMDPEEHRHLGREGRLFLFFQALKALHVTALSNPPLHPHWASTANVSLHAGGPGWLSSPSCKVALCCPQGASNMVHPVRVQLSLRNQSLLPSKAKVEDAELTWEDSNQPTLALSAQIPVFSMFPQHSLGAGGRRGTAIGTQPKHSITRLLK